MICAYVVPYTPSDQVSDSSRKNVAIHILGLQHDLKAQRTVKSLAKKAKGEIFLHFYCEPRLSRWNPITNSDCRTWKTQAKCSGDGVQTRLE